MTTGAPHPGRKDNHSPPSS